MANDLNLDQTENLRAVRAYLDALSKKDFGGADAFFADDIVFHGLVLKASGRATVAAEMQKFMRAAIESFEIEAVAEVEQSGNMSRVLALCFFKLHPAPAPQAICDHITVRAGRITRIENVFDLRKLPPM